jgi:transposase
MKKKLDRRSSDHKTLEMLRFEAIKRVKEGMRKSFGKRKVIAKVANELWVSKTAIYNRWNGYKNKWKKAIKAKKWVWGKKSSLESKQRKKLEKKILWWPKKSWFKACLRTIPMIRVLIKKMFWLSLHFTTVFRTLIDMWFSNQKPLFRAYQQRQEQVETRTEKTLPWIQKEAKKEWRDIRYGDEAWFKSTDHKWKTRAKKWQTPVVKKTWARFGINAVSAINMKWMMKFSLFTWSFTSKELIKFLKWLLKDNKRKVTIILDWHPTHKTKTVKKFVEWTNGKIKIYYLPGYSPELNPDEQVRNEVENGMKQEFIASKDDLKKKISKKLHSLQKKKPKVMSYFSHPEVHYV